MKAICLFFATLVSALAVPGDPGASAIDFLEKVRTGNLDLTTGGDTAISPQTSEEKRTQIAKRLKRMSSDFDKSPLEIGNLKIDEDLAAAIIRNGDGFDPLSLRVFAVALLKTGERWSPAPVPASFENCGLGFSPPLRKRIAELEDWMLREQLTDLENFRAQSQSRMRNELEKALPSSLLKSWNSRQTAERFLQACQTRNLIEFCCLSGGYATELPDNWARLQSAARSAMNATSLANGPWRQLISSHILRVPLTHEEDANQACLTLACLTPEKNPPRSTKPTIEALEINLSKSAGGIWQIDLPDPFSNPQPVKNSDDEEEPEVDLPPDQLTLFTRKLTELHPASPAETAEKARDLLCLALRSKSPSSWVPLVDLTGDAEQGRKICEAATRFWWQFQNPSSDVQPLPLAIHEIDNHAALAIHRFSILNPDRTDLKIFHFINNGKGWLWNPTPSTEAEKSFEEWSLLHQNEWKQEWPDRLLENSLILENFPETNAPLDVEARKLVESFIATAPSGNIAQCAEFTARLGREESRNSLMRNLSYEINAAKKTSRHSEISGVYRGQVLTAVGVTGKNDSPLYPVISTPVGPRILLEFDLASSDNRSREFLNKESLARLRKSNPAAAAELKQLLFDHARNVTANHPP